MKTSESINKIAPALLQAQREMTFAAKDSMNPHFKSSYADLSSVIEACKPALNNAGIVFMQMPSPSDAGTIALTTRLVHESGEWIESTATCPLPKNDPQGYGSANTYLRRYSLASAVGLYQDDDDGNAASRKRAEEPKRMPENMVLDWITHINDSSTVGELKARTAEAEEAAAADPVALARIQAAVAAKKAQAKKTPSLATQA